MSGSSKQAINLDDLLTEADSLPAFPDIVTTILTMIDNPLSVPDDFTEIIRQDQVLVTKILKFANSAYYGFPRKIVNLRQAIIILGLDTLKSIVLAIASYPVLKSQRASYGLAHEELYEHSVCTAMIARAIAKKKRLRNREKYFIVGLLHDIGKLLLSPYVESHNKTIQDCIKIGGLTIQEAEKRVLGFTHSFVGSRLAGLWNFPEMLVQVINYHHEPWKAPLPYRDVTEIIYVANLLSYKIKKGLGPMYMGNMNLMQKINKVFPLTENDANEIISQVASSIS